MTRRVLRAAVLGAAAAAASVACSGGDDAQQAVDASSSDDTTIPSSTVPDTSAADMTVTTEAAPSKPDTPTRDVPAPSNDASGTGGTSMTGALRQTVEARLAGLCDNTAHTTRDMPCPSIDDTIDAMIEDLQRRLHAACDIQTDLQRLDAWWVYQIVDEWGGDASAWITDTCSAEVSSTVAGWEHEPPLTEESYAAVLTGDWSPPGAFDADG